MGDNVFVIHHNASTSRNKQDCLINEPRKITALDGQGLCPVSNKNNPVHTCRLVCLNGGYICHCGHSFFWFCFEHVPLVEFLYLVFTRTPGGVTVGDSGPCCCVPCLSSAIISLVSCSKALSRRTAAGQRDSSPLTR